MTESQKQNLKTLVKEPSKIFWEEPMKKHTTIKIGGPAEALVKVYDVGTLENIMTFAKRENIPVTILGNGSNILVLDKGIKGITLNIQIEKLEMENDNETNTTVTVGAGNKLSVLAYKLSDQSLSGMEELSGIPGTVGGAVYMNAGANGKEIKDIITKIIYLDENGQKKEMSVEEAEFSYRHSIFSEKEFIILEVIMTFEKGNKEEIQEKMKQYAESRKANQPLEYPNSGSTFKRGKGFITAKLIDECGLKGFSIGGAEVSKKHAGFIVNKGNATAEDVLSLIKYIKEKVYVEFGEEIQLEMKILGEETADK